MKVTKIIREYVEREVHNKFAPKRKRIDDALEESRKIEDEMKASIKLAMEEFEPVINNRRIEIARKYGFELIPDYNYTVWKPAVSINYISYDLINDEKDRLLKEKANLHQQELDAIDSVLITLELGATRSELNAILDAIEVE